MMHIFRTKKRNRFRFLGALLLTPIFSANLCAQSHQELLERFEKRFGQLDSLVFHASETEPAHTGTFAPTTVDANGMMAEYPDPLIEQKVDAEIHAFKGKTGVQVSGQTYYRPDETLGIDEEDAVSPYRAKIQAEVRWYFLESSLFQRKGQINELRIKGDIEQLTRKKENIGMLHTRQQEAFQQRYDSLLYGALQHRVENLNLLCETQLYLLERENISSDELLNILNEKAEAERQLASIPKDYPVSMSQPASAGLLIQVDTASYMAEMRKQHAVLDILELEQKLLEQQQRNTTYWSNFRVAPFVRYSHYGRKGKNSQNVDLGLNFIIPINTEAGRKRKVLKAEQAIVAAKQETALTKIEDEIRLILEDVERNNRLMQGELTRLEGLKGYLHKRNEAYNNRKGEYSRLARMKEYNTYLKCRESLLRYQYLRDMRLVELQSYLAETPIQKFCKIAPVIY